MSVVHEIAAAIKRNPKIRKVIVSESEHVKIRQELDEMQLVKPQPRPTYGPPFGEVDRLLWDNMIAAQKLSEIRIMGRPVVIEGAASPTALPPHNWRPYTINDLFAPDEILNDIVFNAAPA